MNECRNNVGRGVVAYPCLLPKDHAGPCMALENQPSINARKRWMKERDELEAAEARAIAAAALPEAHRQVPHPGAPPLSVFQGPPKTSQEGLMEHGATQIPTIDTNRPGESKVLYTRNSNGTFELAEPEPQTVDEYVDAVETALIGHPYTVSLEDAKSVAAPTKQRPGDQPLPIINEAKFIQDLVIADIEERKRVGIERYGSLLQPFNGRNVDQDLYEELVDGVMYARQRLVERAEIRRLFEELVYSVTVAMGDIPIMWQKSVDKILSAL
jgi:hypothetical protein